jgi:beta-glucosidase-like glycosyl hydrolase
MLKALFSSLLTLFIISNCYALEMFEARNQAKLDREFDFELTCPNYQRLAQLFIIGLPKSAGLSSKAYLKVLKDFYQYLKKYQFGGIITFANELNVFKRPKDLIEAMNILQLGSEQHRPSSENYLGLFTTIDQEGGIVQRFRNYDDLTYIPSAYLVGRYLDSLQDAIGSDLSALTAAKLGSVIGLELEKTGFNWNFAPVADINLNKDNKIIAKYGRAFSEKPEVVAKLATAVAKGMEQNQVLSTFKHFPGHGRTGADSHKSSAVVNVDFETLMEEELVPFAEGIKHDVSSIMIGHLSLPQIDMDNPAIFSSKIVNQLLVQEMGFKGLIVSDDFTMGAIPDHFGVDIKAYRRGDDIETLKKAVLAAVDAGVHQFILSKFIKGRRELHVLKALCESYQKDPEVRIKIDQAYLKTKNVKTKRGISSPQKLRLRKNDLKTKESKELIKTIIDWAVTEMGIEQVKKIERKDISFILDQY